MSNLEWAPCPICRESDMQSEGGLVQCTNLQCASNGGPQCAPPEELLTILNECWIYFEAKEVSHMTKILETALIKYWPSTTKAGA